jgi:2-haloacid dehalogenase
MAIKALVFDAYGTLYDGQSIMPMLEAAFPGHGAYITQVWRIKQLEYSWLRALLHRYEDFRTVTRDSLAYTLDTLGITPDQAELGRIVAAYDTLSLYPDASEALAALARYRLAILSNGSPAMLDALVRNSGLLQSFEAIISVDAKRTYKPDPRAYELVQERLGIPPGDVVFVTSNGFDVAGARSFGFNVVRIERVARTALQQELAGETRAGPETMFRALRTQAEMLDAPPHAVIGSLSQLAGLIAGMGT